MYVNYDINTPEVVEAYKCYSYKLYFSHAPQLPDCICFIYSSTHYCDDDQLKVCRATKYVQTQIFHGFKTSYESESV